MIFPETTAAPTVSTAKYAAGYAEEFDFSTNTFILTDGNPDLVYDVDAIKQWLELMCRTLPDKYAVYGDTGFGVNVKYIMGQKKVPKGYVASELWRNIRESAALNPAIDHLTGFKLERSGSTEATIYFTAILVNGEEVSVSV